MTKKDICEHNLLDCKSASVYIYVCVCVCVNVQIWKNQEIPSKFGFIWIFGIWTFVGDQMPNLFLNVYTVPFQTIQFSISTQFKMPKTVLFQTIQFIISTVFMVYTVKCKNSSFSK